MAKKIIRPLRGIDVDSALNRRDDNTIYMVENARMNSSEDLTLGEYTNIKGPNRILTTPDTLTILKIDKISDNIILFAKSSSTDYLCLIKEEDLPKNGEDEITLVTAYYYWGTYYGNKIISGNFGFDVDNEISTKTYYESDTVQKIYWTTDGQPLRSVNIIYSSTNVPSQYSEEDLNAIPNAGLNKPVINEIVSGTLKTGKIFYAYKLINSSGAETNLSEVSDGIHLTVSSETTANDYQYKGYGFDIDSGKGVNLTITTDDTTFNRIKVYSIHYLNDTSVPVVSIVYDGAINTSLIINDTGSPIYELSAEEFTAINSLYTINGKIEIKNNRLFITNYSEEYFDVDEYNGEYWDSRAYSHKGDGTALIYTSTLDIGDALEIDGSTVTYEDVSQTHDCININNDINTLDSGIINANIYQYQSDGSKYGAEGLNILIEQVSDKSLAIDRSENKYRWYAKKTNESINDFDETGFSSYANPKIAAKYKSFKPNEVYRLAIQFKNSIGQVSYPKWICDYRVKNDTTITPFVFSNEGEGVSYLDGKIINLEFTVSNIPSGLEWRILYVPIEEKDQSVFWGAFTLMFKNAEWNPSPDKYLSDIVSYESGFYDGHFVAPGEQTAYNANKTNIGKYLEFISPEYCLGTKKNYSHYSVYNYVTSGNMIDTYTIGGGRASANIFSRTNLITITKAYNSTSNFGGTEEIDYQIDVEYSSNIEDSIKLDGSDSYSRATVSLYNPDGPYSGIDGYPPSTTGNIIGFGMANKGRCQIVKPATQLNFSDGRVYYGCCYVDNFTSRYGGNTYNSRFNNTYSILSDFTSSSTNDVYGDTFVGIFEYLRMISDNNLSFIKNNISSDAFFNVGTPEVLIFPTYSLFNLNLRSDNYLTRVFGNSGQYMIHEYAGVYEDTTGLNPDEFVYNQESDLYLYNKTYSRVFDAEVYTPKQPLSSIESSFKTRINASLGKVIGETTDSFLKIQPSSYIDVDGQYGEIVRLNVFNDRLYFFQKNAIGIAAVNERSQTTDSNGASIIMGEIGLLSRYDYLSINNGISQFNHVGLSSNSLYVIDDARKHLLKIDNGIEKISITKNVNSIVNSWDWSDGRILYNKKYNEVLFIGKQSSSDTNHSALVYNEITQQFTAIYEYLYTIDSMVTIDRYDINDELIVSNNDLHILNDGEYNCFGDKTESTSYKASSITYLVSVGNENIATFNLLEFIVKQLNSSGEDTSFIDTIRVYTSSQDTGELSFATACELSFGKYRTNKLRTYTDTKKKRINSDHIFVTIKTKKNYTIVNPELLEYNSLNYRVFFRDLITSYTEYNYYG
jgi:hypothetical protein